MINQNCGRLAPKERVLFKKEAKKILIDRDWTAGDLAKRIGYQKHTVEQALGCGNKLSKFLILAIADDLEINLDEIRRKAHGE